MKINYYINFILTLSLVAIGLNAPAQSALPLNNIFTEFVENENPPKLLDTIKSYSEAGDIQVDKIHFESKIDVERINKIYAYLIYPKGKTNLPGMLILHGGTQTAESYYKLGVEFAKRGFACVIPDLPGITKPKSADRGGIGSSGKFMDFPYGQNHFKVHPEVQSSDIYEGVVTAIQAFYLLKSQSIVNTEQLGVRGLSWGGYATTMIASLMGNQVKAGFAVYGSGFYDLPSYFKPILDKMPKADRENWLAALDAGRYAHKITAPMFYLAASNDRFFHPPAVEATMDQIKTKKAVLFAPNDNHSLKNVMAPDSTEFAFFDFHLKDCGVTLPEITVGNSEKGKAFPFKVKSELPLEEVKIWYSEETESWGDKKWIAIDPEETSKNQFTFELPDHQQKKLNWYVVATDIHKRSVGTKIY